MAQAEVKKEFEKKCVDIEEITLEIFPKKEEGAQTKKILKQPLKSRFSKLFKKAKLNAKYFEATIPIKKIKYQRSWKNLGVY